MATSTRKPQPKGRGKAKVAAKDKRHATTATALVEGLPAAKRRGVKVEHRPSASVIRRGGKRVATIRNDASGWVKLPAEGVQDALKVALNGSSE